MSTEIAIIQKSTVDLILNSSNLKASKEIMLRTVATRFCDLNVDWSNGIDEKINFIKDEFEKALTRAGQTKDATEKGFLISEIVDIFSEYPSLTTKEIAHIFREGVYGAYGKYFGLNSKTVNEWLECFLNDDSRVAALSKLKELKSPTQEPIPISKEESLKIIENSTKEIFEERKRRGLNGTELLSFPIYDLLKSKGLINLTDEEKEDLQKEAANRLKAIRMQGIGYNAMQAVIKDFKLGLVDSTNEAKVLAVRDYMNNLIENGEELPF